MYYHLLDIALDICLKIFKTALRNIEGLDGMETVEFISNEWASLNLLLFHSDHKGAFAKIYISVSEMELEKKNLHIEVYAELDQIESEVTGTFGDITSEWIFKDYSNLEPVVEQGTLHHWDDRKKEGRAVKRKLKVRYTVHDKSYEEDEDYMYDYDDDDIAECSLPYIKSLLEIDQKVFSTQPNEL